MLQDYIQKYPQLTQPIAKGISQTMQYQACLKLGYDDSASIHHFAGSMEDSEHYVHTDAGEFPVLYLADRGDFIRFIQAVAYKGEPVSIPDSTGAMTILGVRNYQRIRNFMGKNPPSTVDEWDARYRALVALKGSAYFTDVLIVVTKGPYSMVDSVFSGLSKEDWLKKSLDIRTYHELAHAIARKKYPQNKNPIRDEVIADAVGLLHAFGHYNKDLAKQFLGFDTNNYYVGGRLQNYLKEDQTIESVRAPVIELINRIDRLCKESKLASNPCGFLDYLESIALGREMFV